MTQVSGLFIVTPYETLLGRAKLPTLQNRIFFSPLLWSKLNAEVRKQQSFETLKNLIRKQSSYGFFYEWLWELSPV